MTAFSIKLSSEANKLVHFVSKSKKDEKCSLLGVSNLWQKNQRNDNLQVCLSSLLSLIWGTDIRRKFSFGPAMMPWCLMMVLDSGPGPRVTAPSPKNTNSDSAWAYKTHMNNFVTACKKGRNLYLVCLVFITLAFSTKINWSPLSKHHPTDLGPALSCLRAQTKGLNNKSALFLICHLC